MLGMNRAAPMAVLDRDHGDGRPLLEWIDALLADHGIADAGGEVWLHTFPRVFGYVFNPVSFWFAHRSDGSLRAVVCEVNNTFGERHCYLLAQGRSAVGAGRHGGSLGAGIYHSVSSCTSQYISVPLR